MSNEALASLLKVQKDLKAPKDKHNSFGKYNYRSAESILEAAKPLCYDNGLILTCSDEVIAVGSRFYVCATAKVTDVVTGSSFEVQACAREDESKKGMDGSQLTGCCSSYARKYALCGLFAIDDTKDADTDEFHNETTGRAKQTPQVDYIAQIMSKAAELNLIEMDINLICASIYKRENIHSLTANQQKHFFENFDKVLDTYAARQAEG